MGCDLNLLQVFFEGFPFLLTHPVWDVTQKWYMKNNLNTKFLLTHPVWDVTESNSEVSGPEEFLLTHPVWDVTGVGFLIFLGASISTHTSRVGCDCILNLFSDIWIEFLLTHPVWDVTELTI